MSMRFRFLAMALSVLFSAPCLAQDAPAPVAREIQNLIGAKDFDGALKLLDESKDLPPATQIMSRNQIATFLMQANRKEESLAQFKKACTDAIALAKEGKITNQNLVSAVMLATTMSRSLDEDQPSQWVTSSLEIVKSNLSEKELTPDHRLLVDLLRMKMQLEDSSKMEANKNALFETIAKCESLFDKEDSTVSKATTMLSIWNLKMQSVDAQQADQVFERSSKLAESFTKNSPSPNVLNAYIAIASGYISRTARSAPDSAFKALDSVKTLLSGIESEDANVTKAVEGFLKNSKNMERTIEGAKRLMAMIGQPAPEIDPMEWINGEPLSTLADLKGKVVLIDFWAVWCGPCIATFPHLKHLDQEYKDNGLTILGVTRQYNMRWDESTENYARSQTPVELDDEMQMLGKFIAKHQLTHRTMVTPEKSDMQERYSVTGIPHAVVIDKKGIVRLVKVGSGSQNAEEIESMIKKLLDE
jgi:thiol-disulfide isomerase/thioredoxin